MKTKERLLESIGRFRSIAYFGVASLAALSLNAAAPTAGAQIGNQASATYKDQNGTERQATSNTVITTVLQVPGLTLTQNNIRSVSPGGSVFLPHTLTNTGNGTDSFELETDNELGDFTLGSLVIYADTNRDGQPDDITSPITDTGDLTPGESFYFVIGTSVPGSAVNGESATFDITGTSDFSGTDELSATNKDTIKVSEDAVMTVTKLIDQAEGVPGTEPVTYTLSYNNTGNKAATNFTMTDEIPAGMTYIADSGESSLIAGELTDMGGDLQSGGGTTVDYEYNDTLKELTVVIASVPAGASGTISFEVSIDGGIEPQTIYNVVEYVYDPDGSGTPTDPEETNRPPFKVLPVPGVTLTDPPPVTARPGETVSFTNELKNTGTSVDTFDMTFESNDYPAGTTFRFFLADGNTPMVDTNNNGIPDTGPVEPQATYDVIVKATLPTSISAADYAREDFTLTKKATGSVLDPSGDPAEDTAEDVVESIVPPSVDIVIAESGDDTDDVGDGPDEPGITLDGDPGSIVTFPLAVENEGAIQDAYNLTVDPSTVPAGWVVNIRKVPGGAVVNNSGTLNPPVDPDPNGEAFYYVAEVSIPEGELPQDHNITFVAESPTSGAIDTIENTVTVNVVREISLVSDNTGQVSPGGSIVYEHIISNLGNVSESVGVSNIALDLVDSKVAEGWNSIIYLDSNGNGVLDDGDTVISSDSGNLGVELTPASDATDTDSARLFVKVFAPLGAPNGAINVSTLTATTTGTNAADYDNVPAPAAVSNEDTTTVILGDLELIKEQAVDLDNSGTVNGSEAWTTTLQEAEPGATILYRITATNTGSDDATDVEIYDTTPTSTTYSAVNGNLAVAKVTGDGDDKGVSGPDSGHTGNFVFTVGTLAPGESAVVNFGVKIDEATVAP